MERMQLELSFDYSVVPEPSREEVRIKTAELKLIARQTAQGIIEIGQRLVEIKEKVGHGNWLPWLEAGSDPNPPCPVRTGLSSRPLAGSPASGPPTIPCTAKSTACVSRRASGWTPWLWAGPACPLCAPGRGPSVRAAASMRKANAPCCRGRAGHPGGL